MFEKLLHFDAGSINDLPEAKRRLEVARVVSACLRGKRVSEAQGRCAIELLSVWLKYRLGHFCSREVEVLIRLSDQASLGAG